MQISEPIKRKTAYKYARAMQNLRAAVNKKVYKFTQLC